MLNIRRILGTVFVAGAAAAIAVAPAAVITAQQPATVSAQPHGAGGPDGAGGGTGCGHDKGWQGCGGFIPGQGGFGHGCIGGVCGSWDGARGWFGG